MYDEQYNSIITLARPAEERGILKMYDSDASLRSE